MAAFTEEAIKRSFMKLIEQQPYSRITVRDIAADCGINRNTFYYHFSDIPALMDAVIRDIIDRIIEEHPRLESLEDGLRVLAKFVAENRRAIRHVYDSMDRTILETNLWRLCDHVVRTYLHTILDGREIREVDAEVIIRYYKCISFGYTMEWLENGMKEDVDVLFRQILEWRQEQLGDLVQKLGESGPNRP